MPKRDIKLYLNDIIESIEKIEEYTRGLSRNRFESQEMVVDAVIRNLEIIGEAGNHISEEIRERYPDVPWYEIRGMRNKVVHEYFGPFGKQLRKIFLF